MKCKCGTENPAGSVYCGGCGELLQKDQQASQLTAPVGQATNGSALTATQPAEQTRRTQPATPPDPSADPLPDRSPFPSGPLPPRPRKRILLIVVAIVLILGMISIGGFFSQTRIAAQNANATSTANANGQTQAARLNSTATAQAQANTVATTTAAAATANAQSPLTTSGLNNLEDDASQWFIFIDNHGQGGSARGATSNSSTPSVDGQALKVSLESGTPYVGVQAYRNLAPANSAMMFDLSFSFFLNSPIQTTAPIQAVEFTMSKWVNGQRWEWALQWEHIGEGISPQDTTFPWRLWTGSTWQDIGVKQQFEAEKWHTFHLKGNISSGGVQYMSFSADGIQFSFDPQKFQPFQPVSVPADQANKLSVGVQLDGDSAEHPYDVYLDGVNFQWG